MGIDINNRVVRYHLVQAKKLAESNGFWGPLTIRQWEHYLKMKGLFS